MLDKPKVSSNSQKELDKCEKQFNEFQENVESLTLDRLNSAPKEEAEQQTKISNREAQKSDGIYLKPSRSIMSVNPKTGEKEKFNEKFRKDWEFDKEYVTFIAEHKEIIGETIEMWTHPYGGVPAEFWTVPTNKVVRGPRYLAEQIKRCNYHRLRMDDHKVISSDGVGSYTGQIVVDQVISRLDAYPVSERKSVFMGASGF